MGLGLLAQDYHAVSHVYLLNDFWNQLVWFWFSLPICAYALLCLWRLQLLVMYSCIAVWLNALQHCRNKLHELTVPQIWGRTAHSCFEWAWTYKSSFFQGFGFRVKGNSGHHARSYFICKVLFPSMSAHTFYGTVLPFAHAKDIRGRKVAMHLHRLCEVTVDLFACGPSCSFCPSLACV